MKKILVALAIALSLAVASNASAMFTTAKVDYTANRSISTNEGSLEQKISASPGKERAEFEQEGMKIISIMRFDKKSMLNCMSAERMCMEAPFDSRSLTPDQDENYRFELVNEGKEVINGVQTNRSKLTVFDKKGKKLGTGVMWITAENIVMKSDYVVEEGGKKNHVKMELKNLKVGKLDQSIFDMPKGYHKMDMGGMGGMMGGMGRGR